jgi:hypothetical protein
MNIASTVLAALFCASSALAVETPAVAQSAPPTVPEVSMTPLERQIVAKERAGLDALKSGNLELFGSLTADDAILVDAHGPATKAQVLKNVAEFTLTDYSMDNLQFLPLSESSGLIAYKISAKGVSHGKEFSAQAYVSSIWAQRGNQWLCLFS